MALKNEAIIRADMVKALEAQIEAVKTDDEAMYLISRARSEVYADVLRLNQYGRSIIEEKPDGKVPVRH